MPLKRCEDDGKPGWKWGDAGTCYTFTAGDEESETAARKKALAQAAAMGEFTGTGDRSHSVEVEHRSSTVADVNKRQRIVDIIAVPYDQWTDVEWRGNVWHESFDRKAFDGVEPHVSRVQVNREHVKGDTVGKVISADPSHKDGLFARVQMYPTVRGEETLILAEQGGAFPSIGFRVHSFADQQIDKRSNRRRIMRAYWDHQAFVEDPAYQGAAVLAVRSGQSGLTVGDAARILGIQHERPLPATPNLDEFLNDPTFQWASKRFQ